MAAQKSIKDQIIQLKSEGKSIAAISRELGCSKMCVHYNLDPDYKERHLTRQRGLRAKSKEKREVIKKEIKAKKDLEPEQPKEPKRPRGNKTKDVGLLFKSNRDKSFKTQNQNLEQKVKIRLDSRTEVWIFPSQNTPEKIASLKLKYNIK